MQLYRSSATFHTGWCTEVTLIFPQLLCCPLLVLSLLVQSFPSPPCFSSQDDGLSPRVDHHCFIFAFSQPYGAISLSHLVSVDNNTSHIFSFACLRPVSNGCYCFVSVTGLGGSTLLSVSIRSFFCLASCFFAFLIYSPIAVAQIFLSHSLPGWRPRVGVNFPRPYRRQTFCEIVGIAAEYRLLGRLGPSQYNLFFEVSRVAGPSPPSNLSLEVMGTSLIRLDRTPFPWSSLAFAP